MIVCAALLLAAVGATLTAPPARAALPAGCRITGAGAPVRCIVMPTTTAPRTGMQIQAGTGTGAATEILVVDKNGAPMFWCNLFGCYGGGLGGNPVGGLFCVTYSVVAVVACLTPSGALVLQPAGPGGLAGPAEVLTADDIAWIHAQRGVQPAVPKLPVGAP
jgi:hypothetical protein